jgi:endonuclease VIII
VPEGDTIFRVARALNRALAGRTVTVFESVFPALTRIDEDRPLVGRTIEAVSSRGKHLLMAFSGGLTLHTHMRMNGSWHLYRPGEPWQRPRRDMRIVVGTDAFVAVGFNVPVAELLTPRELERHDSLSRLGPDVAAAPDADDMLRRMRLHDHDAIADVLLNQRVVAGIGNVLKSETLFMAGIHPFATAGSLSDETLRRLIGTAGHLMAMNTKPRTRADDRAFGRRTTNSLDPNRKLWVYGRAGKPCLTCGATIEMRKTGLAARTTFWCPQCQRER